jgi:hypothetical protein
MPQVGFEPTIPVSECKKTIHVLDRSVTVIGSDSINRPYLNTDKRVEIKRHITE